MKNFYFIATLILGTGCASTKPEAVTPTAVKEDKVVIIENKSAETDSQKFCETVVDGVKWTYNKSKDVWERVSSEDSKAKINKAWDKTKKVTKEAWDAGKKAYNEK